MSDAAPPLQWQPSQQAKPLEFDAFLSYTHSDRPVVSGIQKGLHHIGRRLGQLRALRVFRDDTDLTASPDLWGRITDALDRSRYLIMTLSPQAAQSVWVNREIGYWLERRGREHLMLVVASGQLRWDEANARFDPQTSNAAPPVLTQPGSLPVEPLFIDISDEWPWDYRGPTFRDKITSLAAPIHGKPKDQLASDDLREQRRFRRLRAAAITGLILLTVVAVVAALVAVAQRQTAIRRLHDATVAKLNAEATAMLTGSSPGGDSRALQEVLAANAIEPNNVPILNAQIARFSTQKIIDLGVASPAHSLAYSPDGSRLVTGQVDGTLRQWDAATGKPVGSPMKGTGLISGVVYTPDGQTIASSSSDGTMRLWNANTGAALNPDPQHVDGMFTIAMAPDGKSVVTAGNNDALRLWDASSGQLLATQMVFANSSASIQDVKFDRSGQVFALTSLTGGIAIYHTSPFEPADPIVVTGGPVSAQRLAFSPDGHILAAGANTLELWNTDTGALVRSIQAAPSPMAFPFAVAFSPDGHRVLTGRTDGAVQLWDPDSGKQIGQTMLGHTGPVDAAAFSPDGRQIASSSHDGTLRLWNATVGQSMKGPDSAMGSVAFSPDGKRVAAIGDTAVQQWDVNSGQPLPALPLGASGEASFGYVDGGRIVTARPDGTVQVWDANTGQPTGPPVHLGVQENLLQFAFSLDGRLVATGELADAVVRLWDVATGQPVGQPMIVDPTQTSPELAFSPDGKRLVVGYYDGGLRIWNVDTTQPDGAVMTTPGPLNPIEVVKFSRDGDTVAVGRVDGVVELWDLHTRKQLAHSPLRGHTSAVGSVAFGPGNQLVSGASDGTLRQWDTATGQPTAAPESGSDSNDSVALSPDGRLAASASIYQGTVRLSPARSDPAQLCDKLSTNMSRKQWRDWVSPGIGYMTLCPGLPMAAD
jgi:WD40 repeat protein